MVDQTQEISIRGEKLRLLPEKLIEWPARRSLLVADTHFGKAATFRNFGIPVPEETTHAMLDRLSHVIERTSAVRLILLGDFVHSSLKGTTSFEPSLLEWRAKHRDLEIVLLRGNHDRGRADLFEKLGIRVVADSLTEAPFVLAHDTATLTRGVQPLGLELHYGLVGHIHPQIALPEGKKKLKLPCFWFGSDYGVLPAYGDFTGCATVKPEETDNVFVVAEGVVLKLDQRMLAT
ncbi:MAG: ligase-associated DNA damage response endonuclease PdeM [Bythopirellula sp.]|nr:ligase-associated DNA damage response endonuclease PdeM [Bythopirellula sp.]